jgi:ABC-2 type transport system permease protein
MKAFRMFVYKEFLHIFRDKRTLLILFGMPIAQVILFGFAITNEIKNARIAVLDQSHDAASRQLTNAILSSGYFEAAAFLDSPDELEEEFRKGKIKLAVVFPPDFGKNLKNGSVSSLQFITDATDPNTANLLAGYGRAIVMNYQMQQATGNSPPMTIVPELRMEFNPELKSVYMFVPGVIAIILMLVSAMLTSIAVAREKELGTMEVLLVSPLRPALIILGKVIPYLVLSLSIAIVILIMGTTVFGMPMNGSLALLLAEITLFVISALSIGILISTVSKTQQTAMMLSMMALMLPIILLSGFIFPIENMPLPLQVISNVIPARWFIIIVKDIMIKGAGFSTVLTPTLILAGTTVFLILLSIRNFKIRL